MPSYSETAEALESLRTLEHARLHWIPKPNGRPLSYSTVSRWARTGIKGVRLQTVKVGRVAMVREEWLADFFRRLSDADCPDAKPSMAPVSDSEFESVGL